MKKVFVTLVLFLLIVAVSSEARVMRGGKFYANYSSVNVENLKKFQKETIALRDDLFTKKIELEQEYSKEKKDYDKITALKKDIVSLQTKIQATAEKYGIKDGQFYNCGNCYFGDGYKNKRNKRCW
ncbi:MAG: hypothetical protein N2999_06900 [Proteobacteria bacterium]|nr:hypothetical protein [Pseudomonadota bacterium]